MREFILKTLKSKTTPDFSVTELVAAGRLDLVCRCIMNALCISNAVRGNTIIHVCLDGPADPPKIITLTGETIKGLNGDELSTGKLIQQALKEGKGLQLNQTKQVSPGIQISKKSFEQLIKEKAATSQLYYLHPKGNDCREETFPENVTIILGDYIGMPKKTEGFLEKYDAKRITIGPTMLFASQCITVIHNELDRKQQ